MTPKVKIFQKTRRDTEIRFMTDQIWWKSAVAKLPKGRLVYHTKKLALRGTRPSTHFDQNGSIAPKILRTLSTLDLSTQTEFGPDRLLFAGLIPERLIFSAPKVMAFSLQLCSKIRLNKSFSRFSYKFIIGSLGLQRLSLPCMQHYFGYSLHDQPTLRAKQPVQSNYFA